MHLLKHFTTGLLVFGPGIWRCFHLRTIKPRFLWWTFPDIFHISTEFVFFCWFSMLSILIGWRDIWDPTRLRLSGQRTCHHWCMCSHRRICLFLSCTKDIWFDVWGLTHYLLCQTKQTLVYALNLSCLLMHVYVNIAQIQFATSMHCRNLMCFCKLDFRGGNISQTKNCESKTFKHKTTWRFILFVFILW